MLPSLGIVKILHQHLKEYPVRGMMLYYRLYVLLFICHSSSILTELEMSLKAALVVDPVMVSTSGDVLAGPSIIAGFRYAKLLLSTLNKIINAIWFYLMEFVSCSNHLLNAKSTFGSFCGLCN